jgi:hypothetical protein
MQNKDFFFYGSADLPKYSEECKPVQYGLYSPALDCFVITHNNKDILRQLALLFSSRYNLILCRLDLADNFAMNLIDNMVCLDWTLQASKITKITRFPDYSELPYQVTYLINNTARSHLMNNFYQDQQYLWAAVFWIGLAEYHWRWHNTHLPFIEDQLNSFVELPYRVPGVTVKNQIYKIIYHEFDFVVARKKIEYILDQNGYDKTNLCAT